MIRTDQQFWKRSSLSPAAGRRRLRRLFLTDTVVIFTPTAHDV